jgi:type IV secretion system protein VirB10
MNQFADGERNWLNPAMPEAPPDAFIVRTGSVIPATLISGINSDLPGQIVGQVAQDVYDTPTGRHLLIPQGSRLVGEYSSDVQYGQSRVFAAWQRIIFPDGKALDIGSMPGSTGAGYAGLRDRVNNHYARIFGSAIMMSAILAGVEMTQNQQGYAEGGNQQRMADALSEALGQQLGGTMEEMLSRNMSIAPTLEIRPGYRLNVMLVKDLIFDGAYRGFNYADGGR